jgi:transposase
VRAVGLDVHRDFCEVAIVEAGSVRSAGRVAARPEALELFAQSLGPSDLVALEVTGNAWEITRILERHVARVIVVSPADTGIRQARAKTDRLDARALAKLLWAGQLDSVWTPDEQVRAMRRRLSRRAQLVRARSRAKNEVHAALMRSLKDRPPASDLFGVKGRQWLAEQDLPLVARDGRLGGPPGRLPRRGDRRGRAGDRGRGAVVAGGQAADDRPGRQRDRRGDVHGRRRRRPSL